MNMANKLPWKTVIICSVLIGLLALMAVLAFHPEAPSIACLTLWAGVHLGPFAAFVFSTSASLSDVLLGYLIAGVIVLPLRVAHVWARFLGSLAVVAWFLLGIANVYSGV